jgi:hypothetical protein
VVIQASRERMHEMLCREFANEFDNRMLQEKNQLRAASHRFDRTFPLIYSKLIRKEIYGQKPNADAPTVGHGTPGKVFQQE